MSDLSKPLPQCNQSVVVPTTTESGRSFYGDKLTLGAYTPRGSTYTHDIFLFLFGVKEGGFSFEI